MNRREFLKTSGLITSTFVASGTNVNSTASTENPHELNKHIIDRVDFGSASLNWPRLVGKNARIGVHGQHKKANFTRLYTNQGASGWGMERYGEIDRDALKESIMGKRVSQLIDPATGILAEVDQAFDIALHDLAGVILNQPVYKMLGAAGPLENNIYSGMIYFDELEPEDSPAGIEQVIENCRWDYQYGYRQLKVKIGRSGRWYPHDIGLSKDIEIIKLIYEEFGDSVDILVDANDMYTFQDTVGFLKGIDGIPIYWIEEPFEEELELSRRLKEWMNTNGRSETYYADGERKPNYQLCLQLAREDKLDVYLPDIIGHGFTSWRELMPTLKDTNTLASPHSWGFMLKTYYCAHIAAGLGNVCTIEGVTCLSEEIDFGDYHIKNGKLRVSEKPGFGMRLLI